MLLDEPTNDIDVNTLRALESDAAPHPLADDPGGGRRLRHPRLALGTEPQRSVRLRGHVVDPSGEVRRRLVGDDQRQGIVGLHRGRYVPATASIASIA